MFVRAGSVLPFGGLHLAAFGQLVCAVTDASFHAESTMRDKQARWGVGIGVSIAVSVSEWLAFVGDVAGTAALSRSEYQFQGHPLLRDPALLVQVGVGLLVTPTF
jgi:hypothetical protein